MEHSGLTHAHPLCLVCCGIYCLWVRSLAGGVDRPFESAFKMVGKMVGDNPALAAALNSAIEWKGKTPTGTGFVVDTLFSARYALENGSDFKDVIRHAILLGNDTDTTAAVAGGLAGVKYGFGGLPEDWMELLRGKELVQPILNRACGDHS
jgi:ADP-ribosyl-[dinitrogen reductase] hydrolase